MCVRAARVCFENYACVQKDNKSDSVKPEYVATTQVQCEQKEEKKKRTLRICSKHTHTHTHTQT